MDYVGLLREKGLGPSILGIYVFLVIFYINPSYWLYAQCPLAFATSIATVAVLLLLLVSTIFNDPLVRLLAEENFASAYVQIKISRGEDKEFYTDYEDYVREALDEMDDRIHQSVIAILSGALIAISALPIGYYKDGLIGLIIATPVGLLSLALLSYTFYNRLHQAIDFAVRETTPIHED